MNGFYHRRRKMERFEKLMIAVLVLQAVNLVLSIVELM